MAFTLKTASSPALTVVFAGWRVMVGGTVVTVRVACEVVFVFPVASVMTQ